MQRSLLMAIISKARMIRGAVGGAKSAVTVVVGQGPGMDQPRENGIRESESREDVGVAGVRSGAAIPPEKTILSITASRVNPTPEISGPGTTRCRRTPARRSQRAVVWQPFRGQSCNSRLFCGKNSTERWTCQGELEWAPSVESG